MSGAALQAITDKFGDQVIGSHDFRGDETVVIQRDALLPVVEYLKEDSTMQFNFCVDICGVDKLGYPEHTGARFEVVYHLYSMPLKHRIRLKVALSEDDAVVDSLSHLYAGANWYEREVWDMFGVRFNNSPDHRRILLYEEFEGHPLRKDYPQRGYQPLIPMPTLPRVDEELTPIVDEDL